VESSRSWHYDVPLHVIADASTGFDQYQPAVECTGDVSALMERLCDAYGGAVDWTDAAIGELREQVDEAIRPDASSSVDGLSPFHLIRQLRQLLPVETIVTGDVGAHKFVLSQVWTAPQPGTFLMSNGLSSMGYGPASAIAASLTRPDQPVVSVTGDGAFAMMVQELETVRRIGVAPLFVVLCDRSLAIIKRTQQSQNLPPRGVEFLPVYWARVAEGFGVRGRWAATFEEVQHHVENWLKRPEPMVLAVKVDESLYAGLNYG
jgi:acetolactate synthase I/II/III large subunit